MKIIFSKRGKQLVQ